MSRKKKGKKKIPLFKGKDSSSSDLYQECINKLDENNIDDAWQIIHQILNYE